MRGLYLLAVLLLGTTASFGQAGNYRSLGSGAWATAGTWERDADSNGSFEESPSSVAPTTPGTAGTVTIQSGHSVNVGASVSIDQTTVQSGGSLVIDATFTLTLSNGAGNEITVDTGGDLTVNGVLAFGGVPNRTVAVNGTMNHNGSITGATAAKLTFGSGSDYFHQFADGGAIPSSSWNANSTVNIVGLANGSTNAPSGLNQTFGHFVWNTPGMDQPMNLARQPSSLSGDLRIVDTGIEALFYSISGVGTSTFNIAGSLVVTGGVFAYATGDTGASTLNISGDMDISAGYIQLADDQNLTINLTGELIISGSGQMDFSATTGTANLNVEGNYTYSGGDVFVNGGTGNLNFVGASSKNFVSTLVPVGNVNYSVATLSTLTIAGSNFVGGGGTLSVSGTLRLGSTDAGGALQTGTSSGNIRVPTANRTYVSGSSIIYNGSGAQFIGSGFPSGGDVNLTIDNSSGVTQSTSLDIVALRTLTLQSGNLSIGAQTLTINGTVTGTGGIVGGISSNLIIGGTGDFGTLTFAGTNQLQNFTLNRTSSGLVTLGGSLTIVGTFTHTAGVLAVGANTLTISGAWGPANPDDLSVTSSSVVSIGGSGTLPTDVGLVGTTLGTLTMNRASTTLTTTSSITITTLNLTSGTFSNGTGITMGTGGTITRTGGSMTNSPTNTTNAYNVSYTSGTFTTGPELPSNVDALGNLSKTGSGTLTLGSDITVNGTFTLTSGSFNAGSRTITLEGDFVSSAGSTLTSSTFVFSGTTTLSGSSAPTFGAVTVSGSFTPNASLQINGDLVNNGTLAAGSATVTFGGTTTISGSSTTSVNNVVISGTLTAPTGNLNVAGSWTNNGTFNRGATSNTVTFNGTTSIAGSSTTNFSGVTISGTLNGPASLNLAGNFTNNGTFNRGTGTVTFNGTSTQSIQGSSVTDFNNITVTNSAGPPAVQVLSNQNLRGVLTLSTNTQFDADGAGSIVFALVSTDDEPTVDAAIATLPSGAQVTGNVTVQRYMSIEGTNDRIYRYISSPVQSAAVSQLQPEIPVTGTFTGASSCAGCAGTSQSMFLYSEPVTTGDVNDGYLDFPDAANTETLATGRGYAIFVRGDIAPVSTAGNASWDVRAPIHSGTVDFVTSASVTFTSSGLIINDGWNLVGNPYPSTIDWDAATGWTRTNINNAIYMRDNGQALPIYATYVAGVAVNGGSRYIPIGQAFFVKSDGGAITFTANENVKVGGQQSTFFREATVDHLLRIALKRLNVTDETVIRFAPGATTEFDPQLDAYKLLNAGFNLFSRTAGNLKLVVNALPELACAVTVPLDISNATAGTYQLLFSEFDSFSDDIQFTLLDHFLHESVDVKAHSTYDFEVTAAAESYAGRFSVTFSTVPLETDLHIEGETICAGTDGSVVIENAQDGVQYSAFLANQPVSGTYVGSGSDLTLNIPQGELQAGENNIVIKAGFAGCELITLPQLVTIQADAIAAPVTVNGLSCGKGSVVLAAEGAAAGFSYRWYASATAVDPIAGATGAQYETPELDKTKTYYVSIINSLGCEGARSTAVATVSYPYDILDVTAQGQSCGSHPVTLTASGAPTDGSYNWYVSASGTQPIAGVTGSVFNTPVLLESKTYYVAVVNSAGCEGPRASVTAQVTPQYSVVNSQGGSRCGNGSVHLSASGAPQNGNYRWYESELGTQPILNQSSSEYTTAVLTQTKTYFVSIVSTTGCEGPRVAVVAEVNHVEDASIVEDGGLLRSNHATGNQWFFNGTLIPGATGQTLDPNQSGTYKVVVTAGTCTTTAEKNFVVTGVGDSAFGSRYRIYPSPSSGVIHIEADSQNPVSVNISNSLGVEVISGMLREEGDGKKGEFDITRHSSGIYLISIKDGEQFIRKKIIKN